jgi:DNA-binding NarL/FixJ family response regulator
MAIDRLTQATPAGRQRLPAAGPLIRRVLIVDHHPLVRLGMRRLLEGEEDLEVCGEAESVRGARTAIEKLSPDAVIMEISLKGGDGFELVRDVRARHPSLPMLILSMHDEAIYAERLLSAGASGYLTKETNSDELLVALRCVLSGGVYATEVVRSSLLRRFVPNSPLRSLEPTDRLSNRELQILRMVGRGISTREIASALTLSKKTVESHRQRIKQKLNLTTAAQLVQYAVRWMIDTDFGPASVPRRDVHERGR